MKRLFTFAIFIIAFAATQIFAQEAYWTEGWNDDTIEGKLTGTSSEAPTTYTEVNATSGVWKVISAYRGGSNMCDGHGRTLRLLKSAGGAITPSLDSGVGMISFVEGRGGTNRIIVISKSADEGLTWELVDTLKGTEKCKLNEFTINDPLTNRVRLENVGSGDCDVDSITVYKATAVGVEENEVPTGFTLNQNYPNPFNPGTVINYSLSKTQNVEIKVYDQLGKEVTTLLDQPMSAGYHSITFNATKYTLSSGVYYIQMRSGDFVKSIKAVLLK